MQPIEYIRRHIFGESQANMAAIAGVKQPTISRWEKHGLPPTLDCLSRIRAEAKRRGLSSWDDSLFFDAPPETETVA